MPKDLYDVLGINPMFECSLILRLADSTTKKPLERIYYVPITSNRNYVPFDFIIMDV